MLNSNSDNGSTYFIGLSVIRVIGYGKIKKIYYIRLFELIQDIVKELLIGYLPFGFPEFANIDFDTFFHEGLMLDEPNRTLFINMRPQKAKALPVTVKGFITWDANKYNLSKDNQNISLILSVKGIPYFNLNMEEYGVTTIRTARPGENKTCLVVECDSIQDEMNISRSGLVDSPKAMELKKVVGEIFQRIETSKEYLRFRRLPEKAKFEKQSDDLADEKQRITDMDQNWVVYDSGEENPVVLIREPKYEQEVNALDYGVAS